MGEHMDIKIDDAGVSRIMERLHAKMRDMTPAMREVGEIVKTSVIKNFEEGGRYSEPGSWKGGSNRWKPLSLATLFAGKASKFAGKRGSFKKGVSGKFKKRKTLIKEGHLMNSITSTPSQNGVEVGTNKAYAAIHNFGGTAGRGKKVSIPARPFLVVQEEDMTQIKNVLKRYLEA
ncbi:phage virion morphogenesis protein [bacterium]|nr:MAG: phage virion morphogenesis protein [bacterium]